MYPVKNNWVPGPIRVREEPPTLREAIVAAENITTDPELQAEFAAGLMGIPVQEVKPHLVAAGQRSRTIEASRSSAPSSRTLVVERKVRRFARTA